MLKVGHFSLLDKRYSQWQSKDVFANMQYERNDTFMCLDVRELLLTLTLIMVFAKKLLEDDWQDIPML